MIVVSINLRDFAFPSKERSDMRKWLLDNFGYDGDLFDIFFSGTDDPVQKWMHYFPYYERYFSAFRGKPVRFLEIGVFRGGSLQMWREYFGVDAKIYGIDIDPSCKRFDCAETCVRIGSQADVSFLGEVIDEMGGVDIVLDDGSHHMDHMLTSILTLFSRMSSGGVYMVEDLHACFWENFGGGYDSRKNFFNVVRAVSDDMHKPYHGRDFRAPAMAEQCRGVHVHDSLAVFERGPVVSPHHVSSYGRKGIEGEGS